MDIQCYTLYSLKGWHLAWRNVILTFQHIANLRIWKLFSSIQKKKLWTQTTIENETKIDAVLEIFALSSIFQVSNRKLKWKLYFCERLKHSISSLVCFREEVASLASWKMGKSLRELVLTSQWYMASCHPKQQHRWEQGR